jgi:acetolactate synthase small subunit
MSSLAEPAPESRADPQSAACFSVSAEPSPGLLPRVTELFAKRGLVPDEIHARVADGRLTVEIRAHGMAPDLAAYIGRCLRQIYLVERVLVSRDAPGDGA